MHHMEDDLTRKWREQADALLPALPAVEIDPRRAAMLTVDMQYVQHPEYGLAAGVRNMGLHRVYEYYSTAIRGVIERVSDLQEACRAAGVPVLHVRIAPREQDGRDYAPEYRMLNENVVDSPLNGEIMREVGPRPGETVFTKVTANVFNSSNIDQVLRNLGIDTLIVAGVVTNGCIESSVRGAADRGYRVLLASDGCSTWTEKGDVEARRVMRRWFAYLLPTQEIVQRLRDASAE